MCTMSLYLDEYTLGQEFKTPARTFTEADTVLFGCLTGDLHPNHFDGKKWPAASSARELPTV